MDDEQHEAYGAMIHRGKVERAQMKEAHETLDNMECITPVVLQLHGMLRGGDSLVRMYVTREQASALLSLLGEDA